MLKFLQPIEVHCTKSTRCEKLAKVQRRKGYGAEGEARRSFVLASENKISAAVAVMRSAI